MSVVLKSSYLSHLISRASTRSYHYKFKRTRVPPLQEPKESPYIVGPYLKPDYKTVEYLTEPIRAYDDNDLEHFIYEPIKVENDEERRVRLLLLEDVEGLGVAGQVVEAPYRFGASKLIAMKKADYFTDFSRSWYKFGPKTFESASSALSPRTARLLKTTIFELPVAKDIVIKPWHLSLSLRLAGCVCPIDTIDADSISEYTDEAGLRHMKCIVCINNHEKVEVRFKFTSEDGEQEDNSFDLS